MLQGADLGLWGTPQWRNLAYGAFGFWPGLLQGWPPAYPLQPAAMFVTHGFLHVGLWHLAVNLIALWSLGPALIARAGQAAFLWLYLASLLGGALGFARLSQTPLPMVGASGALFGLMGAMLVWTLRDRRRRGQSLGPVWLGLATLGGLNLMLWALAGDGMAWQTHLGGFLAGLAGALWLDRRPPSAA